MNKVVISMLIAAVAADTTLNAEFGSTKIDGATVTSGNTTQGNWEISGEKDGKPMSEKVNYVVSGDKNDKKNLNMIKETIKKFDQFFYYAMDSKNLKLGSEEKQCQLDEQCGNEADSVDNTKCCVSAVFRNKETKKQSEVYRCMNKGVVSANMDLSMNDHSVSMRCQKSGAAYMAATFAASAATLAAYTLY